MNKLLLEEKYILEYIRDTINDFKIQPVNVSNNKYHHNSNYKDAPLIIKYGILSLLELNRLGIKKYSKEILKLMDDTESHINGIDSVSLSIVGLPDLDMKKDEYNPFHSNEVDFTISDDIRTRRNSKHYDNEFLCYNSISVDKLKSVDIRLLNLIKSKERYTDYYSIEQIIDKYNCLGDIASQLRESNLDIPFREMSIDNLTMDIDKVSNTPKLILKK
ncbi:MAG: hypothetical protein E7174_04580 [Firmicutes bacterium]|nr:hypothetical protein [Bacillota bacterium]